MTVYYISTTGSDSNNGLAPEFVSGSTGPKATSGAARTLFNAAVAGDQILFARGESWTGVSMSLQSSGGSASNPIVLGSYLHTSAPAAQTGTSTSTGTNTLTDTTKSGTWTTNSEVGKCVETVGFNGSAEYFIVASNTTTTLTFTINWRAKPFGNVPYTLQTARPTLTNTTAQGAPNNAILEFDVSGVDGGYTVQDLSLRGNGGAETDIWGIFLSGSVRDVKMQRLDIGGPGIGVYAGFGNLRYQLLNCLIYNCLGQGSLWGANNSIVQGCTFDNNGNDGNSARNHNFYASMSITDDASGPRNLTFRGNTSLRNAQASGTSSSTAFVFHGQIHGLIIENNYLYQTVATAGSGGYGIAVDAGYSDAEGFFGVFIRNNLVVNCAQNAIAASLCLNPVIEGNRVVIESGGTYANIQGIVIAEQRTPNPGSQASTGATVRNNSFYCNSPATFQDVSLISFAEGDGNSNNAGSNNVCASNLLMFGPSMGAGTYEFIKYGSRQASDFTAIVSNLCYDQTGNGRYSTGTNLSYATIAAAQAASIDVGGTASNPNLVAVPSASNGWSFTVQAGSPAIGGANATHHQRLARGYPVTGSRDRGADQLGITP